MKKTRKRHTKTAAALGPMGGVRGLFQSIYFLGPAGEAYWSPCPFLGAWNPVLEQQRPWSSQRGARAPGQPRTAPNTTLPLQEGTCRGTEGPGEEGRVRPPSHL